MTPKILHIHTPFPDVSSALSSPNGLLAVGGDLTVQRLQAAYTQGIFPWYMEGQPILWWSPDPRAVLFLKEIKISRSLKKIIRTSQYEVTVDCAFNDVIMGCAAPRSKQPGTWITAEMQTAYCQLHENGTAHSIEVWDNKQLIGGLYGVDTGRVFTGESMFSLRSNASKIALIYLAEFLKTHGYLLIDCQIDNPFLQQFGTQKISRNDFIEFLNKEGSPLPQGIWYPQILKKLIL